jgi:hypothetical protein
VILDSRWGRGWGGGKSRSAVSLAFIISIFSIVGVLGHGVLANVTQVISWAWGRRR